MTFLTQRLIQQPQGAVQIDWSNPLSKGLLGQWTPISPDPLGNKATVQGSVITTRAGSAGFAWRGAANAASNNYIRIEKGRFTYTTAVTFEALIRVSSFQSVSPYITGIISQFQDNGSGVGLPGPILRFGGDGVAGNNTKLQWFLPDSVSIVTTAGFSTGVLYHLVGTYVAGLGKIYVNGVEAAATYSPSTGIPTSFTNSSTNFISLMSDYATAFTTHNRSLNGDMFLARIYNTAKTAAEVALLARNPWQICRAPKSISYYLPLTVLTPPTLASAIDETPSNRTDYIKATQSNAVATFAITDIQDPGANTNIEINYDVGLVDGAQVKIELINPPSTVIKSQTLTTAGDSTGTITVTPGEYASITSWPWSAQLRVTSL